MKIDLHPLSGRIGEKLSFELQPAEVPERVKAEMPWVEEIQKISGTAENKGNKIALVGEMDYWVQTVCDRCSKELSRQEKISFEEDVFEEKNAELSSESLYIQDSEVDISGMVEDYLLLSAPSQRLCREECAGLCLKCGADLNEVACECKSEEYNPKFEKLALLKGKFS